MWRNRGLRITTAKVAVDSFLDGVLVRRGRLGQQGVHRHDEAWRAETALGSMCLGNAFLTNAQVKDTLDMFQS